MELEKSGLSRTEKITKIADLNPVFYRDTDPITTVVNKILEVGHRSFPIVSGERKVVGIVTVMDILNAFLRGQNMHDKISEIMSRDVIYCKSTDTLDFSLQKFKLTRRGRLPVLEDGNLVGIVTERDFVKYFSDVDFGIEVQNIMTKKPFYVNPQNTMLDCLKSMVNTRYRRLPVVQNRKLVGMQTVTDVLRFLSKNNFSMESLKRPLETEMIRQTFSISARADVSDAVKIMKVRNIGGVPVVENEILEGFITERDVLTEIV